MKNKYLKFSRFELNLIFFCGDNFNQLNNDKVVIPFLEVFNRALFIRPEYIGFFFKVYTGSIFRRFKIRYYQTGFRFGDFSFSTFMGNRKKKNKKKKK